MNAYREAAPTPEPHELENGSVIASLTDGVLANLREASGRTSEDFYQRVRFSNISATYEVRLSDIDDALALNYDALVAVVDAAEQYIEQHPSEAVVLYQALFDAQALAEEFEPRVLKRRTLERLQTQKPTR